MLVYAFFDEVEKGSWQLHQFLVSWDACVYVVGQEVVVASLFLSLKYPGHDPGVSLLSPSPGALLGLGCGGDFRVSVGAAFKCVLFCLPIKMQIKILNSIKTKSTLS